MGTTGGCYRGQRRLETTGLSDGGTGVGEAHWSQITVSTTKLLAMWWMEWQPSTLRLLIPERGHKVEEREDTLV